MLEMAMVGELTYFVSLQVKQCAERYHITQEKYARNIIEKFELEKCKEARTPLRNYLERILVRKWIQQCIEKL